MAVETIRLNGDGKTLEKVDRNGFATSIGTITKDRDTGGIISVTFYKGWLTGVDSDWVKSATLEALGPTGAGGLNRQDVQTIFYDGPGGLAYNSDWRPLTITIGPDGTRRIITVIPGDSENLGNMDAQFKASNEANEARYQGILSGLDQQLADTNKSLATSGTQQRSDINQAYFGLGARGSQDLVSRGLSGTTIAPTMSAGIERSRIAEQNRLAESLTQQRIGYQNDILSQKYGVMERKSDTFPNMALLNEIYKNFGNAGG